MLWSWIALFVKNFTLFPWILTKVAVFFPSKNTARTCHSLISLSFQVVCFSLSHLLHLSSFCLLSVWVWRFLCVKNPMSFTDCRWVLLWGCRWQPHHNQDDFFKNKFSGIVYGAGEWRSGLWEGKIPLHFFHFSYSLLKMSESSGSALPWTSTPVASFE